MGPWLPVVLPPTGALSDPAAAGAAVLLPRCYSVVCGEVSARRREWTPRHDRSIDHGRCFFCRYRSEETFFCRAEGHLLDGCWFHSCTEFFFFFTG